METKEQKIIENKEYIEDKELIMNLKLLISNRKLAIKLIENKPIKGELREKYLKNVEPLKQKYINEIKLLENKIKSLEQQ